MQQDEADMAENGGSVPDREREDQTEVPARTERAKREGRGLEMDEWKELGGGWQTDDKGVKYANENLGE